MGSAVSTLRPTLQKLVCRKGLLSRTLLKERPFERIQCTFGHISTLPLDNLSPMTAGSNLGKGGVFYPARGFKVCRSSDTRAVRLFPYGGIYWSMRERSTAMYYLTLHRDTPKNS